MVIFMRVSVYEINLKNVQPHPQSQFLLSSYNEKIRWGQGW